VPEALLSWVARLGCEGAQVKNKWRYSSTSPICLHSVYEGNCAYYLLPVCEWHHYCSCCFRDGANNPCFDVLETVLEASKWCKLVMSSSEPFLTLPTMTNQSAGSSVTSVLSSLQSSLHARSENQRIKSKISFQFVVSGMRAM
jgi:hypothetical protein